MSEKEVIIIAALIGAAIGDLLPTVADAIYFSKQQELGQKKDEGIITPREYWLKDTFYYYALNPIYWFLLALIFYYVKGDYHFKVKLLLVLLAAGLVIGVIGKNIKKDTARLIKPTQ